jgi:aspartate racemase
MKNIGLIGGMSWESTALYYQIINREVGRRLGGLHSAPMQITSLNFQDITTRQKAQDWAGMSAILVEAARNLVASGAKCLLIGTNTMHRVAPEVQAASEVPLLHIADVTAAAILKAGQKVVGLMGTRFTMEQSFYVEHLAKHGISCLIPTEEERYQVHSIIFDELCKGDFKDESRRKLQQIISSLVERGAQGVILGCTELPLILKAADSPIPLFDTTALHAMAAVDFALEGELPVAPGQG